MAQSSAAIAPIAATGLVTYLIAAEAGANASLVILIASGGELALGWTLSLYPRRYAGAGSVYECLSRAHGNQAGVLAAGAYLSIGMFANVNALGNGASLPGFCRDQLDFDPGWWTGGVTPSRIAVG